MPLRFEQFTKLRPYLYHLAHPDNLVSMCETTLLEPAAALLRMAGRSDLLRYRRRDHERIRIGQRDVVLRDQAPLHKGHAVFPAGFEYDDLVESLNSRSFFWPGTAETPIRNGVAHFERYRADAPVILRLRFESLMRANPGADPRFCAYNSGSPRSSAGVKSPRGPDSFQTADEFEGTSSDVVEVTFQAALQIPEDAEYAYDALGPWRKLG